MEPTDEERVELKTRARAYPSTSRGVVRAKIGLMAAAGLDTQTIGARLDTLARCGCPSGANGATRPTWQASTCSHAAAGPRPSPTGATRQPHGHPVVLDEADALHLHGPQLTWRLTPPITNTYRVLLTRGLRSCTVLFTDEQTRDFVESRMDMMALELAAEHAHGYGESEP